MQRRILRRAVEQAQRRNQLTLPPPPALEPEIPRSGALPEAEPPSEPEAPSVKPPQ
ncbi:hypothetical protein KW800_01115 [Candidatus Parcubacteria bacterium]|nr:hypothetical protein [Candidatus Parcubacteria bacterium]